MFIDYSDPNNVVITHNKEKYTGKIHGEFNVYWLYINNETNYYPANVLNVDYPKFIESILGYEIGNNSVKSKEDLIKVLDAFNKEYDKKFGKKTLSAHDFVVGEKVMVRNDLEVGEKYGIITFITPFKYYANNIVTIQKITDNGCIHLEEDFEKYSWSPEMFIKLPSLNTVLELEDLHTMCIDTSGVTVPIAAAPNNVSFKAEESKDSTISINNFIKSKSHYKLNFDS